MSTLTLNAFITKAMLDDKFQEDILNGCCQERIDEFDLSDEEKKVILEIKAKNLEDFVHQLNQWADELEVLKT